MEVNGLTFFEAIEEMYNGKVVQIVGSTIGNIKFKDGGKFCMCRGCIFLYEENISYETAGAMVYCPSFRYKVLENISHDTYFWPKKQKD
jgi:hypothetical protein